MSLPTITFHNHSCISIENNDDYILMDPWFEGKVFNNSWRLLEEEKGYDTVNFEKLNYIVVSHEHPDHFHIATLKKISKLSKKDVKFLLPQRQNENLKNAVLKIGFQFDYIKEDIEYKISDDISIFQYQTWMDAAFLVKANGKVILNQNDCKLSDDKVKKITEKFPVIDLWLNQFSLAGYYGNRDDHARLVKGQEKHYEIIRKYYNVFKPKIYTPFASFIYFCKERNQFLNDYIITPTMVVEKFPNIEMLILFYGNSFSFENYDLVNNNTKNLEKWEETYDKEKLIDKISDVSFEQFSNVFTSFYNKWAAYLIRFRHSMIIELIDKEHDVLLDFNNRNFGLVKKNQNPNLSYAKMALEDLKLLFEFPWGADTLNISSTVDVFKEKEFREFCSLVGSFYQR